MERASESGVISDSECNDPAVLLACALGSDGCPAKCANNEENNTNNYNAFSGVVAGDLNIAVSTSSSVTSIPNDGVIKVAELSIKASEDIQLQSLDVTRLGLSENSGIKVWIEKDGRRITSSSSFFGDSKANVTFNNGGYVVKGDETLDLIVSLSNVTAGSELSFKVSGVTSSAKNTTVSPDTTGTFRTTKYSVTSVSVTELSNTVVGDVDSPRTYNVSKDSTFNFGEFKLLNNSKASMEKDVLVRNITFKAEGSIENLNNWKLLRDGKEVSSKYSVDGKSITFTVNDQLDSGKTATYKVTAEPTNIENQDGDTYKLKINKDSDIVAEEIGQNATAYRVSIKADTKDNEGNWNDFSTVSLGTTKIMGGTVTLTRDSDFSSTVTADWGYSDVVIAKGTIKVNQDLKFEDGATLNGTFSISTTDANNIAENVIRRASLVIAGRTYQASSIKGNTIKFENEIYLSKGTSDVELQVSLNSTEVANKATSPSFQIDNISNTTFSGGKYVNSDETTFKSNQMAGTIRVAKVNIQQQKMSFKKTGPSEDVKIVAGNTDERVVLVGEVTNGSDKTLELNKFIVKPTTAELHSATDGTCSDDEYTTKTTCEDANEIWTATALTSTKKIGDLSLYVDGSSSSSVAINSLDTSVSIDSITTTIEPGKTVKFELRIIPNADLVDSDNIKFSVSAEGKLEGNTTSTSTLNSAALKVSGKATTTVVASSSNKKLIVIPGSSREVASFNYNVKNDSVDLSKVTFTVDNMSENDIDDVTIAFEGKNKYEPSLGYDIAGTTLTLTFDNTLTLPEDNYKVKLYVTFANSAVSNNAIAISAVDMDSKGSANGLGYSHYVAKAYPLISVKDKNTNSGNERLDLNLRKSDKDGSNVVKITKIYASATNDFRVVEGTDETMTNGESTDGLTLDTSSAIVIRSNTAKQQVTAVDFEVTDDENNTITYTNVSSTDIADFASLSL